MARRRGQRKGYLRKKGPSWLLEWREDVLLDGKHMGRAKFSQTIAPATGPGKVSKREAERIAYDDILSKLDTVSQRPQSLMTVNDFVRQFFEPDVVLNLKPTGGRPHYEYLLEKHVLPALGKDRLRDVTPEKVQAVLRAKLLGTDGKGYSTQTVTHIRNCIGAIFRHAKGRRMFSGDLPTEGVRIPDVVHARRRSLGWDQAQQLIAALPEPYCDLAFLLATTGLRVGEACGLRWGRVNLSDEQTIVDAVLLAPKTMMVSETFTKGAWGSPKTPTSVRLVPIPDALAGRLARLKQRNSLVGPDDPVFITTRGNPVDRCTTAERFLKPAGKTLGVPWVSWHAFRHSASTFAEQMGLTVSERQRVLGHSSGQMTMRYTHADLDRVRVGLNAVADKLEPKAAGRVM